MSTTYCVRLYSADPRGVSGLLNSGLNMADTYSPARFLVGWAADFSHGASDFSEQLVTFSDPNGSNQVTSASQIDFRCGLPGDVDRDVVWVGLVAASSQGAHTAGFKAQAVPLSYLAVPGGRKRVAGTGRFTLAAGSLTFQL